MKNHNTKYKSQKKHNQQQATTKTITVKRINLYNTIKHDAI